MSNWLWEEMEKAAVEFETIPNWLRPVITDENVLISGRRNADSRD